MAADLERFFPMFSDVITGMSYLWRGYSLLTRRGLRRFVLIPLLVNVLVFSFLAWLAIGQFDVWMEALLPVGDSWWLILIRGVLWVLIVVLILLVMYLSFTLVANVIAAPFNSLLAQKVELLLGETEQTMLDAGFLVGAFTAILGELRKFGYFLVLAIPLLILFVIPLINMIAPLLWFIFISWMLALEYLAYPMENQGLSFLQTREYLRRHRALGLGFGMAVTVAMLVPLINFLVMPAAVAGATLLWVERLRTTSHLRD